MILVPLLNPKFANVPVACELRVCGTRASPPASLCGFERPRDLLVRSCQTHHLVLARRIMHRLRDRDAFLGTLVETIGGVCKIGWSFVSHRKGGRDGRELAIELPGLGKRAPPVVGPRRLRPRLEIRCRIGKWHRWGPLSLSWYQ